MPPISADNYREVMRQYANGVTIVTTTYENNPVGITATSFIGISLNPPLVGVCINAELFTHHAIARSGSFAVNILAAQQLESGKRFAGAIPSEHGRFEGIPVVLSPGGAPLLPDILAWLDCKLWQSVEAGDHTLFIGEVQAAETIRYNPPLLYYNQEWGTFRPLTSFDSI